MNSTKKILQVLVLLACGGMLLATTVQLAKTVQTSGVSEAATVPQQGTPAWSPAGGAMPSFGDRARLIRVDVGDEAQELEETVLDETTAEPDVDLAPTLASAPVSAPEVESTSETNEVRSAVVGRSVPSRLMSIGSMATVDGVQQTVFYDINRPKTPLDTEYNTPMIHGGDTYEFVTEEGDTVHTVLSPSILKYHYRQGKKYIGEAEFLGWAINGDTGNLVQPGAVLDLVDYPETINLQAHWGVNFVEHNVNTTGPMINFFVCLNTMLEDNGSWVGQIQETMFTDSVYTDSCGVNSSDAVAQHLYDRGPQNNQYFVLGDTSGANIDHNHSLIVNSLTQGYTMQGLDGSNYTYRTSFPANDVVIRGIRGMIQNNSKDIRLNGKKIKAEDMVPENFEVRWHVFKYDKSDGWHIDGVLVALKGTMLVKKSFAGERAIIDNVKGGNYSIRVEAQIESNGQAGNPAHSGGTLTLDNYKEYDAETDTYTWELPVDQYFTYYVQENNFIPSLPLSKTIPEYEVRHSTHGENTTGWVDYNNLVAVTGQTTNNSTNLLTVSLLNTYTYAKPGTLVLKKVDSITRRCIPGVTFDLVTFDGTNRVPFEVYSNGYGHYSLAPEEGSEVVTSITTDVSGQAYLVFPAGEYHFLERLPPGYEEPGLISVTLINNPEDPEYVHIQSASAENDPKFVIAEPGSLELEVLNHARLGSLEVEKIWVNGENKPVTIQLYVNGEARRDPVVLDGTVDAVETEPWKFSYTGLPLHINGQVAEYLIREARIGDFGYSPDYPEGYRYYRVNYTDFTYLDEQGQPTTDLDEAVSAKITVSNNRKLDSIAIRANTHVRVYNGNPLMDTGYTVDGLENLMAGDTVVAFVEGTVTDVGKSDNRITEYHIMRGEKDVTSLYEPATLVHGSLEVLPRPVFITALSAEKVYDGLPLTEGGYTVAAATFDTGFVLDEGEEAVYMTEESTITEPGSVANVIEVVEVKDNTLSRNYSFYFTDGTLTVTAAPDPLIAEFTLAEDDSALHTMRVYVLGMREGDVLYFAGAETFSDAQAGQWTVIANSEVPYEDLKIGADNISPCRDIALAGVGESEYRYFRPYIEAPNGNVYPGRKYVGVTDMEMDRYGETSAGVHFVSCLSEVGGVLPGFKEEVVAAISPVDLVQTNTLISGSVLASDKLYLLQPDERFDVYTLGADRRWAGVQNEMGKTPSIAGVTLPRGSGIVLVRMPKGQQDVQGVVRLHGQVSEQPLARTAPSAAISQMASTVPGELDLNDKLLGLVGEEGDLIVYMDEMDTQWDIYYGSPGGASPQWYTWETQIVKGKRTKVPGVAPRIPAGRVFWYSTEARIYPEPEEKH